jgi:hypothetical protein
MKIAILAAFLGVLADILLLHEPTAVYERMDYQFLATKPLSQILMGHYLGVLVIPFELLGLWAIVDKIRTNETIKVWLRFCLAFILSAGIVYHGAIIFVAHILQKAPQIPVNELTIYFEPLGTLLALVFLGLCVGLAILQKKDKIDLPKSLFWINPAFIYLLTVLIYIIYPPLGRYLVVAGFNLSIGTYLLAVKVVKW